MARKGKRAAVPSYAPTSTSVISTHTATHQWQSFEMRMRRRRAERCLLRAEVALEAGFEDDAREALEEARRLDAATPDFDTILATVVGRMREALAIEHARKRQRLRRLSAAAVVALASLAGTAALMRDQGASETVAAVRTPSPADAGAAIDTPASAAEPHPSRPEPPATRPEPRGPSTEHRGPSTEDRGPRTEHRGPNTEDRGPRTEDRVPNTEDRVPNTEYRVPRNEPRVPTVPSAAAPLPVIALPSASVDAPPAPPAEPIVDDSLRVRAVLSQYEAAYSALNVAATRAIWPSVDARSLTRAFDGLDSQRVSLGQCALAIDGRAARADCHGHASYTPKVGGTTRTETRTWRFELKNADGTWQIVRADVR